MLRDGRTIETLDRHEISEDRIITAMVGRTLEDRYPPRTPKIGETIFEVKNWIVYHPLHPDRQVIKGVDLNVRKGEVVGIAGLMGAGRTEFAMSLFGRTYGTRITGEVYLHGKQVDASTVGKAVDARPRLCHRGPQDLRPQPHRPHQAQHHARQPQGRVERRRDRRHARAQGRQRLPQARPTSAPPASIRRPAISPAATSRRWCCRNGCSPIPDVLILDEPTRGIDVGAKYEIYTIINQLADEGKGIW